MTFIPQKAIKGQALAKFLTAHPVLKISKLHEDILDEVIEDNMTSNNKKWQIIYDDRQEWAPKAR